jgi:hypothetical protein
MARRGDEAQTEALKVIEGIIERVNLKLAAIARAGVHLADGEAASEPASGRIVKLCRQLGEGRIVRRDRGLGRGPTHQILEEEPAH